MIEQSLRLAVSIRAFCVAVKTRKIRYSLQFYYLRHPTQNIWMLSKKVIICHVIIAWDSTDWEAYIGMYNIGNQNFDDKYTVVEQHTMQQRELLRHITEIGSSLRLHMNIQALLKQVALATCEALQFRYSALYLIDDDGLFHVQATSGIAPDYEAYLHQHPLPAYVVQQLFLKEYRISRSYFIPAESPLWLDEKLSSFFVVVDEQDGYSGEASASDQMRLDETHWASGDLLIVPLMSADNTMLGFLTPDAPLNELRPTSVTMELLELFANQAAVVIEGARLYAEVRRSSEARAALVKIGRVLSDPTALRDMQTVYHTIYEQVRRVMPTDAFLLIRYYHHEDLLRIEYLMDEGILYPPVKYEPIPIWMRRVIEHGNPGHLFNSLQAYREFCLGMGSPSNFQAELVGSQRPSQSLVFVPIHYGSETLGMLSVQSYQSHVYTMHDLEILQEIGVHAGLAITSARLYTELRDAMQQAQASEQLKNQFLMTASHELRTPLTAIQGYLELLSIYDTTLNDEIRRRFVTSARRATDELVLMLGNVMDTSRVDQEHVTLKLDVVNVYKTVQAILEILEPGIVRERRSITVSIDEQLYVWADDLRLRQILLNILSNALKYTPVATDLSIHTSLVRWDELVTLIPTTCPAPPQPPSSKFVVLGIRDWGAGISKDDQTRLFNKFMRLSNAINSTQRGAGLGLYLCRQLTEAMRGAIWVESEGIEGQGSTFFIALPYHPVS